MIGGIGPWEIALIVIVLLVLFGAKKLPEIGQSLGKGLKEFKKATKELTEPLKEDLYKETEKPYTSYVDEQNQDDLNKKDELNITKENITKENDTSPINDKSKSEATLNESNEEQKKT